MNQHSEQPAQWTARSTISSWTCRATRFFSEALHVRRAMTRLSEPALEPTNEISWWPGARPRYRTASRGRQPLLWTIRQYLRLGNRPLEMGYGCGWTLSPSSSRSSTLNHCPSLSVPASSLHSSVSGVSQTPNVSSSWSTPSPTADHRVSSNGSLQCRATRKLIVRHSDTHLGEYCTDMFLVRSVSVQDTATTIHSCRRQSRLGKWMPRNGVCGFRLLRGRSAWTNATSSPRFKTTSCRKPGRRCGAPRRYQPNEIAAAWRSCALDVRDPRNNQPSTSPQHVVT